MQILPIDCEKITMKKLTVLMPLNQTQLDATPDAMQLPDLINGTDSKNAPQIYEISGKCARKKSA
jgi:hypothetical protein